MFLPETASLDILIHSLPLIQPRGLARLVLCSQRIQLWLKDQTLEDSADLPDPHIIEQGIVEDL